MCQYQTDFYCIIKNAKNNIREYACKPETAKIVTNERCYFYSMRVWNNTHVEATVINVSYLKITLEYDRQKGLWKQ